MSTTERAAKLGRRDGYLWAILAADEGIDLPEWLAGQWEEYWMGRDEGEDGGPLYDAYYAAGEATARAERDRRVDLLRR